MKSALFIIILCFSSIILLFYSMPSENDPYVSNGRHVYPKYRELYHSYYDSFLKYSRINNECGNELMKYYDKKPSEAYKLIYPEGNPSNFEDAPVFDTICYPINH